jgi:cardiolipin synthase
MWGTVLYVWTGLLYTVNALTVARTVPVRGPGGEEREVQ